jgi:hypothetical protein
VVHAGNGQARDGSEGVEIVYKCSLLRHEPSEVFESELLLNVYVPEGLHLAWVLLVL